MGKRIEINFQTGEATEHDAEPSNYVKTNAELAFEIRAARATLLDQADKKINTLEDRGQDASAWREHRNALRDITLQPTFPQSVVWPVPPVV